MTREKAIRLLATKRAQPSTDWQMWEVYTMAIKALEQEPCEDAISRQAAIDETWKYPSYSDPLNVLTEVRDNIKALPSAQPERKTGKWLIKRFGADAQCSECGTYFSDAYDTDNSDAFCRHCGAKMDGLKEDEQ